MEAVRLALGGVGLFGELEAQPAGDVAEVDAGTAYVVAGLPMTLLPDPVGLELRGLQQGTDRALRPGRLLRSCRQLPLGLLMGCRGELRGTGVRLGEHLLGLLPHRLRLGRRGFARGPDVVLRLLAMRRGLGGRSREQLLALGLCLGHPGLDEVAGPGVVLVGPGTGGADQPLGILLSLGPDPCGRAAGFALGLLGRQEASGGGGLGLGQDLVVMGLCRLHEQAGLVAGIGDDLVGVGRAVVEELPALV